MNGESIFSRRLLMGWIAGAVATFAVSLYFMGGGEVSGPDSTGASTFSRSAIGHAGIAEVLRQLGFPVVKSRYKSLEKLSPGGVLVIAEPRPGRQTEEEIRVLLKADRILLVLPKWTGQPSERKAGWLREARERGISDAQWALRLVVPDAEMVRTSGEVQWSTNKLGTAPSLVSPAQFVRGARLDPIVAADRNILLGELKVDHRIIWVLSDPDVISNHGLAREGNAALAAALFLRLRGADGGVVFDETIHGHAARPSSPFMLLFRFPFVIATAQGLIAVALLLWATLARFGAPQPAAAPLQAGRGGLLQNMAKLIEFGGHRPEMVARYVQATVRDAARQLHPPRGQSPEALVAWLQQVGRARGAQVDCGALIHRADTLGTVSRRDPQSLVLLARDTHRWKREILDGRSIHPHRH
jgi:hypothetical protein